MYVRWKLLIFFGMVFWLLNCATEYFREPQKPATEFEFRVITEDVQEVQAVIPQEENEEANFPRVAFCVLSFVIILVTSKMVVQKLYSKIRNDWMSIAEIQANQGPSNKIAVATSITDFKKEETEAESDVPAPTPQHSDRECKPKKLERKKSARSHRHMEKHCAKLREEMMALQVTSSKEQANLSKKIDHMSKEKRDLMKQLTTAQKENRAAKQELEEVLSERSLLIKRLDCATKEIKVNTKSKKTTLGKLEEALGNMDKLKQKFDQVNRDKEILEDKLKVLEKEYNQLKEQQQVYAFSLRGDQPVLDFENLEHAVDGNECGDHLQNTPSQICEDFDISQSERDMRKVQEKLMNLEKSLEKLKLKGDGKQKSSESVDQNWASNSMNNMNVSDFSISDEMNVLNEHPSLNSICTEPECPLEHQECSKPECLLRYQYTASRYEKEEEEEEECELESRIIHQSLSEPLDVTDNEVLSYINAGNMFQRSKSCEDYEDRLSIISEQSPSPSEEGEEEEQIQWEQAHGISNSPVFLEFLAKVLEIPV